jgi:hypothetical protein
MLDHIHCRAICDEIGERLREELRREASEIPPRLAMCLDALARLDDVTPIAPSMEDISAPLSLPSQDQAHMQLAR